VLKILNHILKALRTFLAIVSLIAIIAVCCLGAYRLMMPINIVQIYPAVEVCNGV